MFVSNLAREVDDARLFKVGYIPVCLTVRYRFVIPRYLARSTNHVGEPESIVTTKEFRREWDLCDLHLRLISK